MGDDEKDDGGMMEGMMDGMMDRMVDRNMVSF